MCVCVCVCLCSSGPSGAAEVALQHQPPAAEPPSAHEGGGRRGGEGQSSAHTTSQGSRFVAPLKSSLCPEAEHKNTTKSFYVVPYKHCTEHTA